METLLPAASQKPLSIPAQALMSLVQLLQCTMATGLPVGVVTMSISGYTLLSGFSSTTIANTLVPAETLPVRTATAFVAVMPVPASPSGGATSAPASSVPVGSSSFAPSAVRQPASSPAFSTAGRMSSSFQP